MFGGVGSDMNGGGGSRVIRWPVHRPLSTRHTGARGSQKLGGGGSRVTRWPAPPPFFNQIFRCVCVAYSSFLHVFSEGHSMLVFVCVCGCACRHVRIYAALELLGSSGGAGGEIPRSHSSGGIPVVVSHVVETPEGYVRGDVLCACAPLVAAGSEIPTLYLLLWRRRGPGVAVVPGGDGDAWAE